jgi:hypothetical protein
MPPGMTPPPDTSPEAWAVQVAIWRRMGPEGRATQACRTIDAARRTTLDAIRARHPEYDEGQARLALMRLLYGDDLYARAWPGQHRFEP